MIKFLVGLLQDPKASLFSIGCELGYPDGFSFSNQLKRLTGLRPSLMRECFGWEWIVESWIHKEAESGNLSSELRSKLFPRQLPDSGARTAVASGPPVRSQRRVMRVAEDPPDQD